MEKQPWWEIARGRMARELQPEFERAQTMALDRGQAVKLKLEITCYPPPDKTEPDYGEVEFRHQLVEPAKKSIKFSTILRNGLIVRDASQPLEQVRLSFEDDKKTAPFRPAGERVSP